MIQRRRRANKLTPPSLADYTESTVNFQLHTWQRDHLCPLLERCRTEKGLRVAIHAPPRYGKSIIVSQRFPAWLLGCDPSHRIALAMHNEGRSALFGSVVKRLMLGQDYRGLFPGTEVRKDAATGQFFTSVREGLADGNPSFMALGMLSGTAGYGADTWLIDDPYKSREDAFSPVINEKIWTWFQDVRVRIAEDANVIIMFHRWHEDDLAGRVLATGEYEHYRFPAIADGSEDDPTGRELGELLSPMRSKEYLSEIEAQDPKTFLGLFQGKPRPDEGAFFKRDWLKEHKGPVPNLRTWVRYWDLAVSTKDTGDFTVGALVGFDSDNTIYLRDVRRFRAEWPDAVQTIADTCESDSKDAQAKGYTYAVGVDSRMSQLGFFQDLIRKGIMGRLDVRQDTERGDKKTRASGWAARARNDRFRIVPGDWDVQAFVNECLAFDGLGVLHDDQVDAVSGAYALLWRLRGGEKIVPDLPQPGSVEFHRQLAKNQRAGRR